ncbi:MAG TPA: helix-turn-helix transcriptional regulator [Trebonia sp.]
MELAIGRPASPPRTVKRREPGIPAAPSAGGPTARELEIAALITAGLTNKAVAAKLVISPATVARHVANLMIKLGFRSRAQIAVWYTERR